MIAQLEASQTRLSKNIGSVSGAFETLWVGQFMSMNPPKFMGTKVEEDPQEFVDEIEKNF